MSRALQFGCVAIGGRGVLIEGAPGAGKSSLALALIDRGATLVGDDGVMLDVQAGRLIAAPHPQIAGKLEVRNVGLIDFPVSPPVPVALVLRLDAAAPRFIAEAGRITVEGVDLPLVELWPHSPVLALRAEIALNVHGLPIS
ncbi:MAG: HPr kinase/phosphatase C-terminal domain-containing protein [Novosphingobium sp.]|uniref:HPr kinase/phosphorylase n=1 Tax=Novosphingobium sp. TaxID=1874826 RepID=UPI002732A414|nr:HPr kinase/phosphatase C-terminal domain-containing protein [Novosphingobium sp.]MDP3552150.1 HPr kinase/phosphatase C-terminal domain-containing protein [Novosphingobium sp.]HQS71422.1 HPr kinase/phosphatase C-terminal domain-containing protein [Novosphingobium sp.]